MDERKEKFGLECKQGFLLAMVARQGRVRALQAPTERQLPVPRDGQFESVFDVAEDPGLQAERSRRDLRS